MPHPDQRAPRLAVAAALTAALLAGCGSGESEPADQADPASSSAPSDGPDATDDQAGTTSGDPTAVVTLQGVTYEFTGNPSQCGEVTGGLLVALPLTAIDGSPAPDGAGFFDMTIYPAGLEDQSAISVKLPDGRFDAGYNEISQDTPDVTLDRDGLRASGTQPLTTLSGEDFDASIEVNCA